MALALNHDLNHRLASLIPVDMSPAIEPIEDQYNGYAKGMQEIAAAHVHTRKEADAILQKYEPVASTRQFLLTNARSTPHGITFRIPLESLAHAIPKLGDFPYTPPPPVTPTSPVWNGPTLFIRGTHADYLRDAVLPTCKAFFPNCEVVDIDAGHWVHAEKQKETGDAIVGFLESEKVRAAGTEGQREKKMVGGVEWLSGP